MTKLVLRRSSTLRAALRESLLREYPAFRPPVPSRPIDRTTISVGRDSAHRPLQLSLRARLEHMHIIGAPGGGKTRLIQHLACQDIEQGRGVCIVDPHGSHHGSLYRSMIAWLASRRHLGDKVVHIIDPNAGTYVTGFNPLALPTEDYEPPVVAEAMQQALERVWGEEDLNGKPTLQRVLSAVLTTLTELKLTLAEAAMLFDPSDSDGVRAWAIQVLVNEEARDELQWLHAIASDARGQQDFRQEVTGPRNRLAKLIKNEAIKLAVSQDARAIDFRAALDEGHIILANLSPGPRAGDASVQLLGRLLTRLIFFHTVRRTQTDRAFFLYLDECQLYLSGDVSRMLAETRKYGTGVVLAHQTLSQLRAAGEDMLDAVKSTTNIKIVARIKDPAEAGDLADMVMRHDLERPVRVLIKPTVVDHRLVRRQSGSTSEQQTMGDSSAHTEGEQVTLSESYTYSESAAESESRTVSDATSYGVSESTSSSSTRSSGWGRSLGINFDPGNIRTPSPTASGNTLGETAATYASMAPLSRGRYLMGDARLEPADVSGVALGHSRQGGWSESYADQRGESHSTTRSIGSQRGISRSVGEAWSSGIAHSSSRSTTRGTSRSRGTGTSQGWTETLEPVLAALPSAVHSLANVRYAAGELLRSFTAGRVAISFVDENGFKSDVVQVAQVRDCPLNAAEFVAAREQFFLRSPAAVPIAEARLEMQDRQRALRSRTQQYLTAEPDDPQQFRTKRTRSAKSPVDMHGEPFPPERPPVKGRDRQRRRP